jgi:hypothetical protein
MKDHYADIKQGDDIAQEANRESSETTRQLREKEERMGSSEDC